jgi:hypothetical protein
MRDALISLGQRLRRVASRLAVAVRSVLPRRRMGLVQCGDRPRSLGEHLHTLVMDVAIDVPSDTSPSGEADEHTRAGAPILPVPRCAGMAANAGPTATPLWPGVDLVAVPPAFDEVSTTWVLRFLQIRRKSKLLDLRPAEGQALSVAWFEQLAAAWRSPAAAVPRLGIVLDLERWALWEATIVRALRPISDHGVEVRVFYAQQMPHLRAWFANGQIEYDLAAVLAWLRHEWPSLRASGVLPAVAPPRGARLWTTSDDCEEPWALVLRRIALLVQDQAGVDQVPGMRFELAEIARTFGGPFGTSEALHHLSMPLYWLGDAPSLMKCRVLRAQAAAKVDRDRVTGAPQADSGDVLRRLDEVGLIHSRGRIGSVAVTASGACDVAPVWVEVAAPAAFGRPPIRPRIDESPRTGRCRPCARVAGERQVAARRTGPRPRSPSGRSLVYRLA